jgi:tetratricopeptide (TPR) repeat protein
MTGRWSSYLSAGAFTALLLCGSLAAAQGYGGGQGQPAQQPSQQQPADKSKQPNAAPLSMDNPQPPAASPEEEAAYKAFTGATDPNQKIKLGEDFVQKYPASRYRAAVYQGLVQGYFVTQQVPKLLDAGDKELELNPNDSPVLAVVAQTIARTFNPKAPDADKQLAKAEQYSKKAIEITPTLTKPDNLTDEAFTSAKNDTLAMAHGGLGLVYVRKGQFDQAIPELEQAVKADTHPEPDPVNYYLLGLADDRTSHYQDAAQAYNKCAAIQSSLQTTCKNSADAAKKHGESELSAPK